MSSRKEHAPLVSFATYIRPRRRNGPNEEGKPLISSRYGGWYFHARSVNLRSPSLRLVVLEKAKTTLERFLATSKSWDTSCTGLSEVPAVSEPSHRMRLLWLEPDTPI